VDNNTYDDFADCKEGGLGVGCVWQLYEEAKNNSLF
jgi:hypothetical protein